MFDIYPHMRIFMAFTVIIYCLGPRIYEILGHMLRGTFAILRTLSLIYPCEKVTLHTERACQVWYASKQLVIYQCHDDSTYNYLLKYVKYRYLLWLRFKNNKNSNSLTYKIRHVMIPQNILSKYVTHDKINTIDVHWERVVMTIVIIFFSEWKASVVFNILKTFEKWPFYSTKNDISHHGTFWDF